MSKQKETPKGDATPEVSHGEKALKQALWAVFQAAVDGQIDGNRKHGWVNDDSFAVIEAIVAEDAAQSKCGDVAKYTLSEPAAKLIRLVINPSAYRQKEEAEGGRLDKVEGKRSGSLSSLEKEFNS